MTIKSSIFAMVVALAATTAKAETPTIDGSFFGGSIGWRGLPGEMHVAWKPFRTSTGAWVICGAYSVDNARLFEGARAFLSGARVFADGERVARGLVGLKRVTNRDNLIGAETRCIKTTAPANAVGFEVDFGDGTLRL